MFTFYFALLVARTSAATPAPLVAHRPPTGTFTRGVGADPTSLSPILGTDGYAAQVDAYVIDSLMVRDEDTLEWKPSLATEGKVEGHGKSILFKIRDGVRWHDGSSLTAEDVKFSF